MINKRAKIRAMTSNIYGVQKLRIQTGNRLVASFEDLGEKSREKIISDNNRLREAAKDDAEVESDINENELAEEVAGVDSEDDSVIAKLRRKQAAEEKRKIGLIMEDYKRVTDNISKEIKGDPKYNQIIAAIQKANASGQPLEFIGQAYDYQMVDMYSKLLDAEQKATKALTREVQSHPMWKAFFKDVRGCGPLMAAVCISYFDPYVARHASAFWRYAGLDVIVLEDGTTKGKGRWHTVEQKYIDKNGKEQIKQGLGYNPVLKSKLLGVLGPCIIKQTVHTDKETGAKETEGYGKAYYDYKNRLDNRVNSDELSALHKHRMAMRYMIKQFVRDMWIAWRALEGLEVTDPYEEVFLGRKHHGYNDGLDKLIEGIKNGTIKIEPSGDYNTSTLRKVAEIVKEDNT